MCLINGSNKPDNLSCAIVVQSLNFSTLNKIIVHL